MRPSRAANFGLSEQYQTVVLIPASLDEVTAALETMPGTRGRAGPDIQIDEFELGGTKAVRLWAADRDLRWMAPLMELAASRTAFVHSVDTGGIDGTQLSVAGRPLFTDGLVHLPGDGGSAEPAQAVRSADWGVAGEVTPVEPRKPEPADYDFEPGEDDIEF